VATLSDLDRKRITVGLMRYWSSIWEVVGVSSTDLRAAIDATDGWIDDNQISFNNALPNPAKSNLTLAQKTLLFCSVALARVSIPFLKKVLGEVD